MKQWNFKMKKLYSKTLKNLIIDELKTPVRNWESYLKKLKFMS